MAINAPKTPQYRASERLGGINPRYADLRPARALGGAIINLGKVIEAQGDRMKKERDLSVSTEIYNSWRDTDRQQLSELLSRKGKDAVNLDAAYDEYFNKSMGEADTATENRTQQRIVTEALQQKREQNLDILARYTVTEGKRNLAQQEAGLFANTKADARSYGFATKAVEEEIGKLNLFLDKAHSGMDPEALKALKQAYRSEILFGVMQEQLSRAQDKPKLLARAAENLEAWKEDLGEGYYKLKDKLDGETNEVKINGAVGKVKLMKRFLDKDGQFDYTKAAAWLYKNRNFAKIGLTRDQANDAVAALKTEGATVAAARTKQINELLETEHEAINKFLIDEENPAGALEALKNSRTIKNETPGVYRQMAKSIVNWGSGQPDDQDQQYRLNKEIDTEPEKIAEKGGAKYIWENFPKLGYDALHTGVKEWKAAIRVIENDPSRSDRDKRFLKAIDNMRLLWNRDNKVESNVIHFKKRAAAVDYINSDEGKKATDQQRADKLTAMTTPEETEGGWSNFLWNKDIMRLGEFILDSPDVEASIGAAAQGGPAPKETTDAIADEYLRKAGGDAEKARELATADGYTF